MQCNTTAYAWKPSRRKLLCAPRRHLSNPAIIPSRLLAACWSGCPGRQTCEPDPWFWFRASGGRSAFYRGMEAGERVVWLAGGGFSPSRMCRRQKCQNIEARKTLASPRWTMHATLPQVPPRTGHMADGGGVMRLLVPGSCVGQCFTRRHASLRPDEDSGGPALGGTVGS